MTESDLKITRPRRAVSNPDALNADVLNDVSFEVLLRDDADLVAEVCDVRKLSRLVRLRRCMNWFSERGVAATVTASGLVCQTPREMFEFLFGVTLNRSAAPAGAPAFEIDGTLRMPPEIAAMIDDISLATT